MLSINKRKRGRPRKDRPDNWNSGSIMAIFQPQDPATTSLQNLPTPRSFYSSPYSYATPDRSNGNGNEIQMKPGFHQQESLHWDNSGDSYGELIARLKKELYGGRNIVRGAAGHVSNELDEDGEPELTFNANVRLENRTQGTVMTRHLGGAQNGPPKKRRGRPPGSKNKNPKK